MSRAARAAAAALAALVLAACADGDGRAGRTPEPLPPIATDRCPAPGELLAEPAPRGDRLPDVTLPCLGHAGEVRMRLLGRRPYVVNLWAAWCGPCKDEMPEFEAVRRDVRDRVAFLGVDTTDTERNARAIVQNTAITYPSVVDEEGEVKRALGIRSLPATVFVGPDGVIRRIHVGQLTGAELRDLLDEHLGVR